MSRYAVGKTGDFEPSKVRIIKVGDDQVGVVFLEGKFYAWEDRCTHEDYPLGAGPLEGCVIECPQHGARYDVRTGRVLAPPAMIPLQIYQTEVDQDQVYVILED